MSLTSEDKQWIVEAISASESRLSAAIERVETSLLHEISNRESALESRLSAAIERVETSLLTEFHKWASPLEARMRTHSATLRAIDLEMESLAERVTKLEPPH